MIGSARLYGYDGGHKRDPYLVETIGPWSAARISIHHVGPRGGRGRYAGTEYVHGKAEFSAHDVRRER